MKPNIQACNSDLRSEIWV